MHVSSTLLIYYILLYLGDLTKIFLYNVGMLNILIVALELFTFEFCPNPKISSTATGRSISD